MDVEAPRIAPPAQGCTNDRLFFSGTRMRMFSLGTFSQHPNHVTDQTLFQALVDNNSLIELADVDEVKYHKVVLLLLQGTDLSDMETQAQQLYEVHETSSQALSLTGNALSLELMVGIVRNRSLKPFTVPTGLRIGKI